MRFQHQPLGNVFNRDYHSVNLGGGIEKRRGIRREQRAVAVGTINRMMDVLHRLAGFENILQRQRLPRKRVAFRVSHMPVQNAVSSMGDGVLGQAENFFSLMVGKSDFSSLIGDDNAHRAGFHDAADEIPVAAEALFSALAFDRVPYGAFEGIGVELAFDQIVRGSGLHGFQVNFVIALTGQQNHWRPAI